jgi:hypothetical protein
LAFQESDLIRNAKLNSFNAELGASPTMKIFSGAEPTNCAAPDPAGTLITITLPAAPFAAATGGVIIINANWTGSVSFSGTAASFRIYDTSGNCAFQGDCITDLILNFSTFTPGQALRVTAFTVTSGNA